jgi:hypothetical protein
MPRRATRSTESTKPGEPVSAPALRRYHVELELVEPLLGTWGTNGELTSSFIASTAPEPARQTEEQQAAYRRDQLLAHRDTHDTHDTHHAHYDHHEEASDAGTTESTESTEDAEPSGPVITRFPRDEQGLYLWDYQLLGFLREAAATLRPILGVTNLRSKIEQTVYIRPRRIYLHTQMPDGTLRRPLRAMTMRGPRVTLVESELLNQGRRIQFELLALPHPEITTALLRTLLDYGQLRGLGQWRNGGWGRFVVVQMVDLLTGQPVPPEAGLLPLGRLDQPTTPTT